MRGNRIIVCIFMAALIACFSSCTTGRYMTLKNKENVEVVGNVSASFVITGAFRFRSVINTQAYINLLGEAQKEYQGEIDVRDINWVIGENLENNNYTYTAIGKVVRTKNSR